MSFLERRGMQFSLRNTAYRAAPWFVLALGLTQVIGRGTVPESHVPGRGTQVPTMDRVYDAEMHRSPLEEAASEFGLFVNSKYYPMNSRGFFEYDGEAPKHLDFGYRLKAGSRSIDSAILSVDGNVIDTPHTVAHGAVVGQGRMTDFTAKGNYVVDFEVKYSDGNEDKARVVVRKKDDAKQKN